MESVATVTGVSVVSVVWYLWNQCLLLQGYSWSRLCDTYGISVYCYRGIRGHGCVIPMESVATVTGVSVVSVVRYLWNQCLLLQGYSWSRLCDTYGISVYCYRGIRGHGCVIPMESVATVTGVFVVSVVWYLWNQWLLLQGYPWSRLCDTYGISGYCYRGIRGLGCVIPMESVATVTGVFVASVVWYLWNQWLLLQGYPWSRLCDTYGISGYCYRGIRGHGCVIPMESVATVTGVSVVSVVWYLWNQWLLLQGYSWSRCVIPMESVAINTKIKSSISGRGYVYSIQRLVIKFDNDLWQIGSFLQGLRF